jgi:hypothetical protein
MRESVFGWLCENAVYSNQDWSHAWKCGRDHEGHGRRIYYLEWRT